MSRHLRSSYTPAARQPATNRPSQVGRLDPPLNPMGAAALAAISSGLPNAGPVSGPCDADLVEAVVMVLLSTLLGKPGDFTSERHIAEDRIREIGPEATVRELMLMRREAIKKPLRRRGQRDDGW
jgi:hypothetical protein